MVGKISIPCIYVHHYTSILIGTCLYFSYWFNNSIQPRFIWFNQKMLKARFATTFRTSFSPSLSEISFIPQFEYSWIFVNFRSTIRWTSVAVTQILLFSNLEPPVFIFLPAFPTYRSLSHTACDSICARVWFESFTCARFFLAQIHMYMCSARASIEEYFIFCGRGSDISQMR